MMIATAKSLGTTILERIGNTPLVRLDRLTDHLPGIQIVGKAEWANPGGSVKDRAASSIVVDAMKRGLLSMPHGSRRGLLDATSGNTGIAYAMLGAAMRLSGDAVHAVECVRGAEAVSAGLRREGGLDESGGWLRWCDSQGAGDGGG